MKMATIQSTLKSVLESVPCLEGVTVLLEDGAADNDVAALDQLNTGKGVAIIVQRIARCDSQGDGQRPAEVRYIVPVTIQEKVSRNRTTAGTGKPAQELIDEMLLAVLQHRDTGPRPFSLAAVPVVNLGAEHGLEEYVITFCARVTYV